MTSAQNNPPSPYINVHDPHGGEDVQLPMIQDTNGNYTATKVIPSGLGSSTAGVTDSADKRFITDTQQSALVALTAVASEQLLAGNKTVDMNAGAATLLYTVPAGKTCVITKVIVRVASISLTTASYSFGFNGPATYDDVIANATHTELTGPTLLTILAAKAGAKLGAAADAFKCMVNTPQGAAATAKVDVYGYTY